MHCTHKKAMMMNLCNIDFNLVLNQEETLDQTDQEGERRE